MNDFCPHMKRRGGRGIANNNKFLFFGKNYKVSKNDSRKFGPNTKTNVKELRLSFSKKNEIVQFHQHKESPTSQFFFKTFLSSSETVF